MSVHIFVPGPAALRAGGLPYYMQGNKALDVVNLKRVSRTDVEGSIIKIKEEWNEQPVLIVTELGGYIFRTHSFDIVDGPLYMVESPILAVHPLGGPVDYRRSADASVLNELKTLVDSGGSFFDL